METTKAIRMNGPLDLEIIDIPFPEPKAGEALVKVKYGGICGSDYKIYLGKMNNAEYPLIGGHEFTSEIVEVGKNDFGLKPGMVTIGLPYFGCGSCWACNRGFHNACPTNRTMGVMRDGGYAQYLAMPVHRLIPGKGIPADLLTLVEPFQCGMHTAKRCGVKKGNKVVVFGAGPIGIFVAMACKLRGADMVYSVDVSDWRLQKALSMGIDGIFNPSNGGLLEWAKEMTNGENFDVAIECVGCTQVYQNCIDVCTIGGTVGILGVTKEKVSYDYSIISMKELHMVGARNGLREDFEDIIDLIATDTLGKDIRSMISGIYDFTRAKEVFEMIRSDGEHIMKMMLNFDI